MADGGNGGEAAGAGDVVDYSGGSSPFPVAALPRVAPVLEGEYTGEQSVRAWNDIFRAWGATTQELRSEAMSHLLTYMICNGTSSRTASTQQVNVGTLGVRSFGVLVDVLNGEVRRFARANADLAYLLLAGDADLRRRMARKYGYDLTMAHYAFDFAEGCKAHPMSTEQLVVASQSRNARVNQASGPNVVNAVAVTGGAIPNNRNSGAGGFGRVARGASGGSEDW